ncbi:MAG: hypothetical protein L6Q99_16035 [Planctomycetes bacterium]|nr:hypothetical protein [Planctomycetota bacterium]
MINAFEMRVDLASRLAAWMVEPRFSPVRAWRWQRDVRAFARDTNQPVTLVVRGLVQDALVLTEDEP